MQYRESQMENSTLTTNKETACDDMSLENHNMDLETTKNRLLLIHYKKRKGMTNPVIPFLLDRN